jgi:hypothetical protein
MKMLSLSIIMSLFAGIIFLFFANIKNLMYIYFTETKDLSCIKKAFRLGFKKVHLFIIPYLTIIASFLVFYNIYLYIFAFLFGGMAPLESAGFSLKTFFFYLIAPLIMFGLWFRIYLYSIFKSLEH